MSFFKKQHLLFWGGLALLGLAVFMPNLAHAASAGGTAMPYDSPLKTIQRSLTGTVAQIIVIVAIVGAWILAGSDELKEICKKLLMIAIAGGFIMFADKAVTAMFSGGAMIEVSQEQIQSHQQDPKTPHSMQKQNTETAQRLLFSKTKTPLVVIRPVR